MTASEKIELTKTRQELAVLQNEVENVKCQNTHEHSQIIEELKAIKNDIRDVLDKKVDKSEYRALVAKLWGIVVLIIGAFVGMVVYVIQGHR